MVGSKSFIKTRTNGVFVFSCFFLNLNLQKSSLRKHCVDGVSGWPGVGLHDFGRLPSNFQLSGLDKHELHCSVLSQQGAVWQHQGVILFVTSQSAVEIVLK